MTGDARAPVGRRLPAAAYRVLVLLALRHAGRPLSKGELAWDVRANHPTITRVLAGLADEGLVGITARQEGGYAIALTDAGHRFAQAHAGSLPALFAAPLADHFRYGARPRWLP